MTRKYVWAFISFMDNEMVMGHGEFENEVEAMKFAMFEGGFDPSEEVIKTASDIKQFAFDCDAMVGAYCVS